MVHKSKPWICSAQLNIFKSLTFHFSLIGSLILPFYPPSVTWVDSSLTFSNNISNFARSSYFHLRRLRAIRKSVSIPVFTSILHAFVCSRIDYCNSLLIVLPKVRLSPIQTLLNAVLLRFSHISSFITQQLHWLPSHHHPHSIQSSLPRF